MIFGVAWPLFIFLTVKNYQTVGMVQTAALFGSLGLLWWLRKKVDKKGSRFLKLGVFLNSLVWLWRSLTVSPFAFFFSNMGLASLFIFNPFVIFFSNIVYGLGNLLVYTPFDSLVYKIILRRRKLEFLVIRELAIHSGGLIGCLVVWQLIKQGVSWSWVFNLALVGLILPSLLLKKG